MRIDRLFHVLVVHGGLLVAGCDDEDDGPSDEGASASADDDGSADEAADDAADEVADDAADDADDDAADDGDDDSGSSSGGNHDDGAQESSSEGGVDLNCSPEPDPYDTCGCPCCWANDCINTDECCSAFSDLCTPPA